MAERIGPRVTIDASCHGCEHARSTYYAVQGDSGFEYSCAHAAAPPDDRRTHDGTPDWCPFLALAIEDEFRAQKERIAREYAERWPDDTDESSRG